MKIQYFQDTDTLYIEFRAGDIVESGIWTKTLSSTWMPEATSAL